MDVLGGGGGGVDPFDAGVGAGVVEDGAANLYVVGERCDLELSIEDPLVVGVLEGEVVVVGRAAVSRSLSDVDVSGAGGYGEDGVVAPVPLVVEAMVRVASLVVAAADAAVVTGEGGSETIVASRRSTDAVDADVVGVEAAASAVGDLVLEDVEGGGAGDLAVELAALVLRHSLVLGHPGDVGGNAVDPHSSSVEGGALCLPEADHIRAAMPSVARPVLDSLPTAAVLASVRGPAKGSIYALPASVFRGQGLLGKRLPLHSSPRCSRCLLYLPAKLGTGQRLGEVEQSAGSEGVGRGGGESKLLVANE